MSRENTLHLGKCSPVALLFVLQTKEVSQPHDLAQAGSLAPTSFSYCLTVCCTKCRKCPLSVVEVNE